MHGLYRISKKIYNAKIVLQKDCFLNMNSKKIYPGFTFIEILISLLILSLGILSYAGLQLKALRYSQETYFKNLALNQAHNISEQWLNTSCKQKFSPLITTWNQQNQLLLPQGNGSIEASDNWSRLELRWNLPLKISQQHLVLSIIAKPTTCRI